MDTSGKVWNLKKVKLLESFAAFPDKAVYTF